MLGTYMDLIPSSIRSSRVIKKISATQKQNYHTVELDQCFVRYRIEGKGSHTIVFATDAPVTLEDYDVLIAHLASHYRIVVLELPGFGLSLSKLSMSFEFDACTDVLLDFLSTLDAAPYVLAFPCAAGYFSIRMADRAPSEISHLVMLQTPDWQQEQCWKKGLDPKKLISTPVVGQVVVGAMKRKIAHQWIEFACRDSTLTQKIQSNCAKNFDKGASYSLASALQVSLPHQQPQLNKISQPSIAIFGRSDRSHKHTNFHTITKYFHDIDVVGLEGVGHLPELEAPEDVSRSIRSLIDRNN